MRAAILRFAKDEQGAVTVDWVVLTAAIVALNVAIFFGVITDGLKYAATAIGVDLSNAINQ